MYSKKFYNSARPEYTVTPPPGYDGSRFRMRSDGRDDAFPPYDAPTQIYRSEKSGREENNKGAVHADTEITREEKGLFPFLRESIGQEELLIIALLIILVSEETVSSETVLMLGLLLCL